MNKFKRTDSCKLRYVVLTKTLGNACIILFNNVSLILPIHLL